MFNINWCTTPYKCTSQPFRQVICFPIKTDLFSCQNSDFWWENRSHNLYQPMREPKFPAKTDFGEKTGLFWQENRSPDKMAVMYTCMEWYHQFWCTMMWQNLCLIIFHGTSKFVIPCLAAVPLIHFGHSRYIIQTRDYKSGCTTRNDQTLGKGRKGVRVTGCVDESFSGETNSKVIHVNTT